MSTAENKELVRRYLEEAVSHGHPGRTGECHGGTTPTNLCRMPVVLSRAAACSALGIAIGTLVYYSGIAPPIGPPEPSALALLAWVPAHQQRLLFQFVIGYLAVLYAVLIVVLVELNGSRGILAQLAYLGAGANIAIALTYFGLFFGVWTFVQRGGTDQALVAMVTGAEAYAHAQLMATGRGYIIGHPASGPLHFEGTHQT